MSEKSGDRTIDHKQSNFGISKLEILSVLLLIVISVAPMGLLPSNHHLSAFTDSDPDDEAYYYDDDQSEYDIDTESGEIDDDGDNPEGDYVADAVLLDDSATTDENSYVTVNVLANDRAYFGQNGSITIDAVSSPSYGNVIINSDNTITYRPSQLRLPGDSVGTDSFSYTASYDNGSLQYTAIVSIVIQQANDRPLVVDSEYTVANDQEFSFYLKAYDEDDDTLEFFIASFDGTGEYTLDPISGMVTYLQYQNETGEDILEYGVLDEDSTSALARVSIITVEGNKILITEQEEEEEEEYSDYDGADNEEANDLSYDYYDDHYSNDEEEEGEDQPTDDTDNDDTDNDDNPSSNSNGTSNNQAPIADAGSNLEVLNGEQVELDGSGSYDPDGDEITYAWSQASGSPVALVDPEAAHPTFAAPEQISSDVTLTFELVVSDGNSTSQPSSIIVLVIAPDADSGPDCTEVLTIANTSASGYQSQHLPANAVDGDPDSRWWEYGIGSWIRVDLAAQMDICGVDISWYNGTARSSDFIIAVSDDGTNFTEVFSDTSSGNTDSAESYTFSDVIVATYIRITVNGNTQNDNASITEIVIKGQV